MEKELELLVEKRKNLIKSFEENGFTDGIHALLTDLYPDTAHFIYELLQNAEDMDATKVRFALTKEGIKFEHNGTKRSFNIADIDSITSIGNNSQKKGDPTSIGKFGVGFKAVFAYTATPIIHSGRYHFQIENYFVPEFQGACQVETIDSEGTEWTRFEFPFNNSQKPTGIAYKECREGLDELNASTILFLQNIKEIEYSVPNMQSGYVKRMEDQNNQHIITAIQKRSFEKVETRSKWLRFSELVDIVDDQGKQKHLSIAVAYSLKQDEKTKHNKIVPIQGNTFIYFPAEKEHSGLRFHINAPFASTVARDSVRACDENTKLIKAIAKLVSSSLAEIKSLNLMDFSFFDVLPNDKDQLTPFYQYIFDHVYDAFQKNDYLPTRYGGGFVTAKNALCGPPAISSVFAGEDLKTTFGINKTWIQNALNNSNADRFIQSLDVQSFSYEDCSHIFGLLIKKKVESLLLTKDNTWLKRFYSLCVKTHEELNWRVQSTFVNEMCQAKGTMAKADEIFILPPNVSLITRDTPIVDPFFISKGAKNDKAAEEIRTFFRYELEIQEYGPKVEIEKLIGKYSDRFAIDDDYFKDMIAFSDYMVHHNDLDFSNLRIFLFQIPNDENLYAQVASKLYLGQAYGNEAGEILADAYNTRTLWDGYKRRFAKGDLQKFIYFAEKCGIKRELKIISQSAKLHPCYNQYLFSSRQYTGYGANSDYSIDGLENLLKNISIPVSKMIWECLLKNGVGYYCDYVTARYSPNGSAPTKTCDSTLVYLLKQHAWVPNTEGKFYKPEDISIANIYKELKYDPNNQLLKALQFGIGSVKRSEEIAKLEKQGLHVISDEDFELLKRAKALEEARRKTNNLSTQELLKKQRKTPSAVSVNDNEDESFPEGEVNNIQKRETNIETLFKNAQRMKAPQRRLFGHTSESTKEEKSQLRNWYHGKCQMCSTQIIGANQQPHFVARNVINTSHLSDEIRNTTFLAWNSWCLCPNCAAKYDVCSRDINGLYEQIIQKQVIEGATERIILTIELDGRQQEIRYVPKHFLALKKVFELIDKEIGQQE